MGRFLGRFWRFGRTWLAVAALLAVPLALPGGFALHVAAQACVAALACLSLNVLLGEAGLLSFGHALHTGLGAVLALHALRWLEGAAGGAHALTVALVPLAAAAGVLLLTAPLALLCARRTGAAFAMLTLAFGELAAAAALMGSGVLGSFFGGEAGLSASRMAQHSFLGLDWGSGRQVYGLIAAYTLAAAAAMAALRRTRCGLLLRAARDDAARLAALGGAPQRLRALAQMQAAFFAGMAGALGALLTEAASASQLGLTHSGAWLLFTLLGGSGAFWGPATGGALMAASHTLLAALTPAWPLVIGLLFIAMMVWAPGGLVDLVQRFSKKPASGQPPDIQEALQAFENKKSPLPLRLENLEYRAGGRIILKNISLDIPAGQTLAILGANGAGKSTLFDLIGGQQKPSSGRVFLAAQRIDHLPPHKRCHLGLARSFQSSALFACLTVQENLRAALLACGTAPHEVQARATQLAAQLGLARSASLRAADLSHAAQRALEFGLALAGDAPVLLLDEPTAGMGAEEARRFAALIRQLAAGRTLLIVEHDVNLALSLAGRVAVLHEGRLIAQGSPDEMRASAAVQRAYLGVHEEEKDLPPPSAPADDTSPLLQVHELRAWHGSAQALHGVSFEVRAGETVLLAGHSGSGRTSCARALMGLLPAQGSVRWRGRDIGGLPAWRIARLGIGYMPEGREIFSTLTVEQNLRLGRKRPVDAALQWSEEELLALFPRLAERRRTLAGTLSGGEQQMLALCRTLMGAPALVILDEPCEGLAPQLVHQVQHCLRTLQARGGAIILIGQPPASFTPTRTLHMERGRITHWV